MPGSMACCHPAKMGEDAVFPVAGLLVLYIARNIASADGTWAMLEWELPHLEMSCRGGHVVRKTSG
jgi:hypothetical protein